MYFILHPLDSFCCITNTMQPSCLDIPILPESAMLLLPLLHAAAWCDVDIVTYGQKSTLLNLPLFSLTPMYLL